MLCKDCTYWKLEPSESYLGLGKCTKVRQFWDSTEWSEDGDYRQFLPECEDLKAFVQDGSDYRAVLFTKPDFGCVQFRGAYDNRYL